MLIRTLCHLLRLAGKDEWVVVCVLLFEQRRGVV